MRISSFFLPIIGTFPLLGFSQNEPTLKPFGIDNVYLVSFENEVGQNSEILHFNKSLPIIFSKPTPYESLWVTKNHLLVFSKIPLGNNTWTLSKALQKRTKFSAWQKTPNLQTSHSLDPIAFRFASLPSNSSIIYPVFLTKTSNMFVAPNLTKLAKKDVHFPSILNKNLALKSDTRGGFITRYDFSMQSVNAQTILNFSETNHSKELQLLSAICNRIKDKWHPFPGFVQLTPCPKHPLPINHTSIYDFFGRKPGCDQEKMKSKTYIPTKSALTWELESASPLISIKKNDFAIAPVYFDKPFNTDSSNALVWPIQLHSKNTSEQKWNFYLSFIDNFPSIIANRFFRENLSFTSQDYGKFIWENEENAYVARIPNKDLILKISCSQEWLSYNSIGGLYLQLTANKPTRNFDIVAQYHGVGLNPSNQTQAVFHFKNRQPVLGLDLRNHALLSNGNRKFQISAINTAETTIKVKKVSENQASRLMKAIQNPQRNSWNLPEELIEGEYVYEKTFKGNRKLNCTETLEIDLKNDVKEQLPQGLYFVEARTTPSSDFIEIQNRNAEGTEIRTQGLVQITNIGLVNKIGIKKQQFLVFDLSTGKPITEDIEIEQFDDKGKSLGKTTYKGTCEVSFAKKGVAYFRIKTPQSEYLCPSQNDSALRTENDYGWIDNSEYNLVEQKGQIFTDRPIYLSGDDVHLKGYIRSQCDGKISTPSKEEFRINLSFDNLQNFTQKDITLSEYGSFDFTVKLPKDISGYCSVEVQQKIKSDANDNGYWSGIAYKSFYVGDFVRKSFEVTTDLPKLSIIDPIKTFIPLSIQATNYSKNPVSNANGSLVVEIKPSRFFAKNLENYHFGISPTSDGKMTFDEEYYKYYYGWESNHYVPSNYSHQTFKLNNEGKTKVSYELPVQKAPSPQIISFTSSVTDNKEETNYNSKQLLLHSSSAYVGISRKTYSCNDDKSKKIDLIATTTEGKALDKELPVTVNITRKKVHFTTIHSDNKTSSQKHEVIETLPAISLNIAPNSVESPTPLVLQDPQPGEYTFKIEAKDPEGRPILTTFTHWIYSNEYSYWDRFNPNESFYLIPDKSAYSIGETARVLLLTPVKTSAIVTIGTQDVSKSFIAELTPEKPWIDIPITKDDIPNNFVSVSIIYHSKDKDPQILSGHCSLVVKPEPYQLNVEFAKWSPEIRPGEKQTLSGVVKNAQNNAVPNAEVTLYAVDQGVLDILPYETPDPISIFYSLRSLRIASFSSFSALLSENLNAREIIIGNKGTFIGGGDMEASSINPNNIRKNFKPCAIWLPKLITDQNGEFKTEFNVPDTLTRYKVFAIAADKNLENFGNQTGSFVVNKPVSLEANVPTFAYLNNELTFTANLANMTQNEGTWKVSLSSKGMGEFIDESSKTITLNPNEQTPVSFTLKFNKLGKDELVWKAEPVTTNGKTLTKEEFQDLSDAALTPISIRFPLPLTKELQFAKVSPESTWKWSMDQNDQINHEGASIAISTNPITSISNSIDYLLNYPYGCCEQTASSTLPWILAKNSKKILPNISRYSDEKIEKTIQFGVDRLLQLQLPNGGFAYWMGEREQACKYSAYATQVLLMAKQAGANVPDAAINTACQFLKKDLIKELNATPQESHLFENLSTLVLANQLDEAILNNLISQESSLPADKKAILYRAMSFSKNPAIQGSFAEKFETIYGTKNLGLEQKLTILIQNFSSKTPSEKLVTESIKLLTRISNSRFTNSTYNAGLTLQLASAIGQQYPKASCEIEIISPQGNKTITLSPENPLHEISISEHEKLPEFVVKSGSAYINASTAVRTVIGKHQINNKPNLPEVSINLRKLNDKHKAWIDCPPTEWKVGDIVLIELSVQQKVDKKNRPLIWENVMLESYIPSGFSIVNPFLEKAWFETLPPPSQGEVIDESKVVSYTTNQDYKFDRAAFFFNSISHAYVYYVARVVQPGKITVPSTIFEEMYNPEIRTLTHPFKMTTNPKN